MDIRAARTQLGWSRADLAARAQVDKRVLQLLELGLSHDDEARARCVEALTQAGARPEDPGAPGTGIPAEDSAPNEVTAEQPPKP